MNKLGLWGIVFVAIFILVTLQSQESHAAANANLFVSVEDSATPDRFGGPMVIEVTINDPDLKDTDETETEPFVTVNGDKLRMVQATDGNWYGYFADRAQAQLADSTVGLAGFGLDFGRFCPNTDGAVLGIDVTKTVGFALFRGTGGVQGNEAIGPTCSSQSGDPNTGNVVRNARQATQALGGFVLPGQIGLVDVDVFPFIQLYDFATDTDATIVYNIGGGSPQSVAIEFDDDLDDFASLELNKQVYLNNEFVLVTITDAQLNIDPTSRDSWTWGTATSVFYRLFDEDGQGEADGTTGAVDLLPFLPQMMFGDNGVLTLQKDDSGTPVVFLRDNDIQELDGIDGPTLGGSISAIDQPVTFLETERSSGIFVNFDDSNSANIAVTSDAGLGMKAIINYNQNPIPIEVSVDDDGDGLPLDIDCDDNDPLVGLADTWYRDLDGDGFGDPSNSQEACTMPVGFVSDNTDCNDDDSAINPSATDTPGDGIDQDCNGADAAISNSAILDAINSLQTLVLSSLGDILDLLQNPEFGLEEIKSDTEMIKSDIEMLKEQSSILDKKLDILLKDDYSEEACDDFQEKADTMIAKGKEIPLKLEKSLALCNELFP